MANDKCINLEDIDHNLGCDGGNVAGIAPKVIFGYHEDVDSWPDEPIPTKTSEGVTPLDLEEAGALIGDVVMKEGTRAFSFEFTEDVGNLTVTTDGEVDGMSVIYTLTIVKAKISKRIFGLNNAAMNRKLFFIVQDENGVHYLMGNKRRGCTYVAGGDGSTTGTTSSDRNQTTMQFTFRSGKALIYEGVTDELLTIAPAPAPGGE